MQQRRHRCTPAEGLVLKICYRLTEQQFLACMKSTAPGPNTFDRNELLRQFDELQSIKCDKTDIVAQAMELSSIPTDMNNNSDIVSQAMQMSNISSDIVMEF